VKIQRFSFRSLLGGGEGETKVKKKKEGRPSLLSVLGKSKRTPVQSMGGCNPNYLEAGRKIRLNQVRSERKKNKLLRRKRRGAE